MWTELLGNAQELEANVSSSHAVSQFVLVPEERHEANVSLDLDALVQEQDAVGLPGNWLPGVVSLCCIFELIAKALDLWTRAENTFPLQILDFCPLKSNPILTINGRVIQSVFFKLAQKLATSFTSVFPHFSCASWTCWKTKVQGNKNRCYDCRDILPGNFYPFLLFLLLTEDICRTITNHYK